MHTSRPSFDVDVPAGGYHWWYADAESDCGRFAVVVIGFVGSVFSPYYDWKGRKSPEDHVAINVALYGPGQHVWAMTERGQHSLQRDHTSFEVGPSRIYWQDETLRIDFDEWAVPNPPKQILPKKMAGSLIFTPKITLPEGFSLHDNERHHWWPHAPSCAVRFDSATKGIPSWQGHGYADCNGGSEPLQRAFIRWDWARGRLPTGDAVIIYDPTTPAGHAKSRGLLIGTSGEVKAFDLPPRQPLGRGFWGVDQFIPHEGPDLPKIAHKLEDGPFYTRARVKNRLLGEDLLMMHESLLATRLESTIVKLMLPFRMPRNAGRKRQD